MKAANEGGDAPSAPLSGPADADDDLPLLPPPDVHIHNLDASLMEQREL